MKSATLSALDRGIAEQAFGCLSTLQPQLLEEG